MAASDPTPLSIPPSGSWQGVDGQWSTFHVQVGTPGQTLHLLPGSSVRAGNAIWAIAPEGCTEANPGMWNCEEERGDVFSANESSTWSTSRIGNDTYYQLDSIVESMLGLNANASYGVDTITVGTSEDSLPTLSDQLVARIASNDFWVGVLGLSPIRFNSSSFNDPVPTLIGALSDPDTRTIPSTTWAYTAGAFYKDAPTFGSLTLGGYDASRFDPNQAVTVPFSINPSQDLQVNLQSITFGSNSTPLLTDTITAYINSMIPYIWLPPEVCDVFEEQLGIEYDTTTELYLLNETTHDRLPELAPDFTFTLGGANSSQTATIVLPYAALDLNVSYPHVNDTQWYFPIKRAQYISQYTLGRVFLQEAYVIADYDRRNFTVAQALFSSNATPELVTILPPDADDTSSGGLGGCAIAGIVVGVVAALVFVALAFWFWRRRRQQRAKQTTQAPTVATEEVAEAEGREIQEKSGEEVAPAYKDYKDHDAYKQTTSLASDPHSPSELATGQTPSSLLREGSWPQHYSELPAEIPPVPEVYRRNEERQV